MYAAATVVISRPWSRDSSALELILSRSRSRSRDLKKGIDNNTGNCPPHISSVFTLDENTLMAECARRLSSMSKLLAASGDFACSDSYLRILTTFFAHVCSELLFVAFTWPNLCSLDLSLLFTVLVAQLWVVILCPAFVS